MLLSNEYGKLINDSSLLIVTGKHVAKVYELKERKVFEHPVIDIPDPWLTDKDGTRRRAGNGTIWGTASEYQQHDNNVRVEFFHLLERELKKLLDEQDFISINIFSPPDMIKDVRASLPKPAQKKVDIEYVGNFVKLSPDELAKKMRHKTAQQMNKAEKLNTETEKILDRKKTRNESK